MVGVDRTTAAAPHRDVAPARSFDLPTSARDLALRLPCLIGAGLLLGSALLPWSRRFPYSRHSGLDTARIVLGLHHRIAFLPSRSVAWLWCLVPAAGALAWAVAWLRPAHAGLLVIACGLVAGTITGWFGVLLARRHPANVASGVVVAAMGAFVLLFSAVFLDRPLSPRPRLEAS